MPVPVLLERLNLDPYRLMDHLRGEAMIEKPVMLGSVEKLKQAVVTAERKFVKGITEARRLVQTASLYLITHISRSSRHSSMPRGGSSIAEHH